jgi:hypothetical protein
LLPREERSDSSTDRAELSSTNFGRLEVGDSSDGVTASFEGDVDGGKMMGGKMIGGSVAGEIRAPRLKRRRDSGAGI